MDVEIDFEKVYVEDNTEEVQPQEEMMEVIENKKDQEITIHLRKRKRDGRYKYIEKDEKEKKVQQKKKTDEEILMEERRIFREEQIDKWKEFWKEEGGLARQWEHTSTITIPKSRKQRKKTKEIYCERNDTKNGKEETNRRKEEN